RPRTTTRAGRRARAQPAQPRGPRVHGRDRTAHEQGERRLMFQRDPLADPAPLIRRVYGFVAYRIGAGPDAEDVTSEVFERAVRYRHTYKPSKGEPAAWLIGIAWTQVAERARRAPAVAGELIDGASGDDFADAVVRRLTLEEAV